MSLLFRVVNDSGSHYGVVDAEGTMWPARLAGRFFAKSQSERPIVGDWIEGRLENSGWVFIEVRRPRTSVLMRRVSKSEVQELAANVDLLVVLCALNEDFNLNRLDRYVALAQQAAVPAAIVLTKADLVTDTPGRRAEVRSRLGDRCEIHVVSLLTGDGVMGLRERLGAVTVQGGTVAVMGSSGVGKSTLTNLILGEERMATGSVRDSDGRGRHTTTRRELVPLSDGGWWMDTPGLRGLRPEFAGTQIAEHFADLEELILRCRFTDCGHENEPGCAVRAALHAGTLDENRWESFWKLKSDEIHQQKMEDPLLRRRERERFRKLVENASEHARFRRRGYRA